MDENKIIWNTINCYFKTNYNFSVKHHLDSYNSFFNNGIKKIFQEKNPIRILKDQDTKTQEYKYECNLYLGGRTGEKLYYGKPIIYDDERSHFMYPNEARLRNMTYGFSIHYDIDVEFFIRGGKNIQKNITLEKIYLGRFPIMLQSDLCILRGLSREVRFNMGECKNDWGGYFIIDGKEKAIVCQEKFAPNMLKILELKDQAYSHVASITPVSEDASKPIRTLSVKIKASSAIWENKQIVVEIPMVRKEIPLFIVMRALGIISDKEIITTCLLNLEKEEEYIEFFRPSVHDAASVFTQQAAIKFIASFLKHKTVNYATEVLANYFLPNIGELNFKQKAFYLGYMVKRLLAVYTKKEPPTDRDNFKFKRIETSGDLISQLFNEYYNIQLHAIYRSIDKEYYYHQTVYQDEAFYNLIENNQTMIFSNRIVEEGFRKAFKGNWGAQSHTKRLGVIQDLNRLSYFSFVCHLRKLNVPLDSSAKVVGPRLLHGTQWGKECPIHTPDGGNIGLHKHLSVMTHITSGTSGIPFISWLREKGMLLIEECSMQYLSQCTKIFINGGWAGVVTNPKYIETFLKLYRRNGLIPIFTSIYWDIARNEIQILTDKGRAMRPIFHVMGEDLISWGRKEIVEKIMNKTITWKELTMGLHKKKVDIHINNEKIYKAEDVYSFKENADMLGIYCNVIDYLDAQEEEGTFVAMDREKIITKKTTHVEIHPSLIFGIMANQIIFPENNPLPRDLFSCGQSKQATSLYHSNYQNRIDKMGIILNYGQIPLLKSRYLKFATNEEHPYGENAIVAIACYSGYNVEDAIIVNKASLDRGLFRTTYFNMYETREESDVGSESKFCNIHDSNVLRLRVGYDYNYLDESGLIKENTKLNDKIVLIGKCTTDINDPESSSDSSVVPKKGQLGYVDKSFMTEGNEGHRLAKVRVRHVRIPAIGDKFCSRAGQKGTIGIILPEADMPFSQDGIRPDIIVNPHAFPSRMTIGHLIESLVGKACTIYGAFSDCTAFMNKGPKDAIFGEMLIKEGFHSSGTEVLYNGMTGEQIEADIYFGPTYYLRLKHMVKDKINYRARGPRTVLTRQTVQGRANNGGLRIGEMDRDAVIGHGMSEFLNESFMVRGDEFFIAICNKTGSIAVYNETKNIFLSPMCDGPLQFTKNLAGEINIKKISRFGRDFSVVRVPYAFKLLYQELQTMNIQMRIITEDNIDKLTTLRKGDNIQKLSQLDNVIELIADNYNKLTGKQLLPTEEKPEEKLEEKLEEEQEEQEEEDSGDEREKERQICKEGVHYTVYNPRVPNVRTDIPYALDTADLEEKIKDILNERPAPPLTAVEDAVIFDKLIPEFFNNLNKVSKLNTINYLFYKIHSGYFLQIQGGNVKRFIPFYNVHFKNTWGHLLKIDDLSRKNKINQNREQWSATNCLLRLEDKPLIDKYPLSTFMQVKDMFSELCTHHNIPDIDLFINVKDFPLLKKDLTEPFNHIYNSKTQPIDDKKDKYYPILSFNSNETFTDIPIPSNQEWSVVTQKVFPSRCLTSFIYPKTTIPWEEKQKTAIFRGTATGCSYTIEGNPRLLVSKLDKEWGIKPPEDGIAEPYLDAGITHFPNKHKTTEGSQTVYYPRDKRYAGPLKEQINIKEQIPMQEQNKFKYVLNIPGNSAAYRLSYLLRCGSVILNVESENKLWWEHKWEAKKHYIPVQADLSDLKEKIEWCRANDGECRKIVTNAKEFADKYISKEGIFSHLKNIITLILSKQSAETNAPSLPTQELKKYRTHIIVPFRDDGEGKRSEHLRIFKTKMAAFIPKVIEYLKSRSLDAEFDISIIKQSKEHSFNRGALLNIGFKQDKTYDAYIFHDVDLIPNDTMIPAYAGPYDKTTIAHIASEWGRYKQMPGYLGGILLVGGEIFERANGFPNNFYGWGGEDDELRRRFESLLGADYNKHIKKVGIEGGLEDLEKIETFAAKKETIKDKNPVRWEGAAKHKTTWKENGLNQDGFYEIEGPTEEAGIKTYIAKLDTTNIKPFGRDEKVEARKKQKGGGLPEPKIMFKKEIIKESKTPEELGQDVREQEESITKSHQFPSIIGDEIVKLAEKGPSQEEMDAERQKRREEIGGFKWNEDNVNEFLKNSTSSTFKKS